MSKLDNLSPESLEGNPRASLSAWLRYESLVLAAYRSHPKPYRWIPTNMSAATVASRFREALRGCLAFEYPITEPSITHADLKSWYGETCVKHTAKEVIIGPVEAFDLDKPKGVPVSDADFVFDSLLPEDLHAFCVLIAHGHLRGTLKVITPPLIQPGSLPSNITVIPKPDGTYFI